MLVHAAQMVRPVLGEGGALGRLGSQAHGAAVSCGARGTGVGCVPSVSVMCRVGGQACTPQRPHTGSRAQPGSR